MANEGLRRLQQEKREDSIERVNWALQYLRDLEGVNVQISAAKLAEVSELSRAVLYKPHLRSLWDPAWLESSQERNNDKCELHLQRTKYLEDQITHLETQWNKSENKRARLEKALEKEKSRSLVYRQDYEELKARHQKLLYVHLKALRKLHIHGIDTSELLEGGKDDLDPDFT
ncbi:DUF6262 family protein [Salibacterium qingdaonense]|uniref:Uncharacterized protein n=1 Tax=Salibacterium qingdaonense TaxID=266892 RepID=A0A1I4IN15_9BACI|nr:DUF6262 family protein [Salibacterium qingdaonense]SFL55665.1 hypothetical protein SAMN04488054_102134 [Salibacterium qingdaonense]